MRSSSPIQMLLYEAKHKSEIAALVERAPTMTDDELVTIKVPLPWFRIALRQIRDQHAFASAENRILNGSNVVYGTLPDFMGEMREFTRLDRYVDIGNNGALLIKTASLFFLPDSGGVWFDNLFSAVLDPILDDCRPRGRMSRETYIASCRAKREAECPPDAPIIDLTGGKASSPMVKYGVSFF